MVAVVSSSWLFEIMVTFSILSFIQVNELYLRIILISSTIFTIIWACVPLKFQFDIFIFAVAILIINIVHSIFLLIPIVHIKVGKEELKIYEEIFSKYMTRYHYKKFIDSAKKEIFTHNTYRLVNEGEQFRFLYLVINPQQAYKSYIRRGDQILREYTRSFAWIGFPEMVNKMLDNEIEYDVQYDLISVKSGKLIIYKFDANELADLCHKEINLKNALYSVWMNENIEWIQYFEMICSSSENYHQHANCEDMKTKFCAHKFY